MADHPTIPLAFERPDSEEQLRRAGAFFDAMKTRRTVRDFSDDPVDPRLIELAVATAGRAPSGANQQPWTFAVVTDRRLKATIRRAAEEEEMESYDNRMPAEWKNAIAHLGTDWRKPHLEDAPALIVVFEQVHGIGTDGKGRETKIKHYYSKESVGIAVGFLIAALHMAGLATLTHTPSPMNFIASILKRPKNEKAFVILPVGYPAKDCRVPDIAKKPVEEILARYD